MEVTSSYQAQLDKELTYSIPPRRPIDPPIIIKNMGIIRAGLVTVPAGRTDLIPEEYEIVDKDNVLSIHCNNSNHIPPQGYNESCKILKNKNASIPLARLTPK